MAQLKEDEWPDDREPTTTETEVTPGERSRSNVPDSAVRGASPQGDDPEDAVEPALPPMP